MINFDPVTRLCAVPTHLSPIITYPTNALQFLWGPQVCGPVLVTDKKTSDWTRRRQLDKGERDSFYERLCCKVSLAWENSFTSHTPTHITCCNCYHISFPRRRNQFPFLSPASAFSYRLQVTTSSYNDMAWCWQQNSFLLQYYKQCNVSHTSTPTAAVCMENDNSELCLSLFVDRGESKKNVVVICVQILSTSLWMTHKWRHHKRAGNGNRRAIS